MLGPRVERQDERQRAVADVRIGTAWARKAPRASTSGDALSSRRLTGARVPCGMAADALSDRLRDLENQRLAAVVAGDVEGLEELHTPSFVLCTPSGDVWSRRHYLDRLADGTINYLRFEPVTPIEVIPDAHLAVLRYRSEIEISVGGSAPGRLACWHLDVYQRTGNAWRCRWSQATDAIAD